jgi:hypothetical protein
LKPDALLDSNVLIAMLAEPHEQHILSLDLLLSGAHAVFAIAAHSYAEAYRKRIVCSPGKATRTISVFPRGSLGRTGKRPRHYSACGINRSADVRRHANLRSGRWYRSPAL